MASKRAPDEEGVGALFYLTVALFEHGTPESTAKAFDLCHWLMMTIDPGLTVARNAQLNMAGTSPRWAL